MVSFTTEWYQEQHKAKRDGARLYELRDGRVYGPLPPVEAPPSLFDVLDEKPRAKLPRATVLALLVGLCLTVWTILGLLLGLVYVVVRGTIG